MITIYAGVESLKIKLAMIREGLRPQKNKKKKQQL